MNYSTKKLNSFLFMYAIEGHTNKEIADKVGVHEMTISRITTGKTKKITPATMKRFAEALEIDLENLI